MNRLMIANPPAAADSLAMAKFASIGVGPGKKFDLSVFNEQDQRVIEQIPRQVLIGLKEELKGGSGLVNGWKPISKTVGSYGTNYPERALVSFVGLGANLPADALYPTVSFDADGNPLHGSNKYVLHYEKGQTPPTNAFWSLTMYDAEGYMVANPINRNAIGDRSNLKVNEDGSIDIYFQHSSPGKSRESNWLPTPTGDFNMILRIYWPKQEVLDGTWKTPPVKKVP